MNILITGANGFLGREFERLLQNTEHALYPTNRNILDVSDRQAVDEFFKNNKIDIVLHTAFVGVKNNIKNSEKHMIENLLMHKNIARHSPDYRLMFSFGSGAAFDRKKKIDSISESELSFRYPLDYYGMAKNTIARDIIEHNGNIINLRLFGCFGPLEQDTRLIKNSINRAVKNKSITIHQDKKMDFFYVDDLLKVIMFCADNHKEDLPKDINMSYREKLKLSEIGAQINNLTGRPVGVIINNKTIGAPYTGDPSLLQSLGIDLNGLEIGIENMVGGAA
jgi:GDP-L-fucose synthase